MTFDCLVRPTCQIESPQAAVAIGREQQAARRRLDSRELPARNKLDSGRTGNFLDVTTTRDLEKSSIRSNGENAGHGRARMGCQLDRSTRNQSSRRKLRGNVSPPFAVTKKELQLPRRINLGGTDRFRSQR